VIKRELRRNRASRVPSAALWLGARQNSAPCVDHGVGKFFGKSLTVFRPRAPGAHAPVAIECLGAIESSHPLPRPRATLNSLRGKHLAGY